MEEKNLWNAFNTVTQCLNILQGWILHRYSSLHSRLCICQILLDRRLFKLSCKALLVLVKINCLGQMIMKRKRSDCTDYHSFTAICYRCFSLLSGWINLCFPATSDLSVYLMVVNQCSLKTPPFIKWAHYIPLHEHNRRVLIVSKQLQEFKMDSWILTVTIQYQCRHYVSVCVCLICASSAKKTLTHWSKLHISFSGTYLKW